MRMAASVYIPFNIFLVPFSYAIEDAPDIFPQTLNEHFLPQSIFYELPTSNFVHILKW